MRGASQRQEVTFLAIAVGVLVIVVGLFLALRSLSRKQTMPAGTEQPEQELQAAPEQTGREKPKSERDPFARRRQSAAGGEQGGTKPEVALKLVGIVDREGGGTMAVIRSAERRFYARPGERVAGYRVVAVERDRVVLQGQGGEITLLLRQPEEAAGGG